MDKGMHIPPAEDRIRFLPCWNGFIEIEVLKGGMSNESFLVRDARGKHVVRIGRDYPFHHVYRDRELMTARAAHDAGFGPRVEYAEPGVMVSTFIEAKTYKAIDVARERLRIADLLQCFHQTMPRHVQGAGFMFWVFHVIRDYARTLEAGQSRMRAELPRYLALAEALEGDQIPMPIVFGHHDLLPSNVLDDGSRLWLIDYEYAGFSTPMFDLAGATSNAGLTPDESTEFLTAYLGHEPNAATAKAMAAMQCASLLREAMWSMVSELYLTAPGADYVAYTAENLEKFDASVDRYKTLYGKRSS